MKNTRYITWCAVFCALGSLIAAGIPHIRCGGRTGTAAHAHTGNGRRISARTSCRWYNGSGVASSQ